MTTETSRERWRDYRSRNRECLRVKSMEYHQRNKEQIAKRRAAGYYGNHLAMLMYAQLLNLAGLWKPKPGYERARFAESRAKLNDRYVKGLLHISGPAKDVPASLIRAKRAHLILVRMLKGD